MDNDRLSGFFHEFLEANTRFLCFSAEFFYILLWLSKDISKNVLLSPLSHHFVYFFQEIRLKIFKAAWVNYLYTKRHR